MQFQPAVGEWRKAAFSVGADACVEVATLPDGGVAVRHSKEPGGPTLRYSAIEWRSFMDGVKGGEFDYLLSAVL
jgi:hypothetical protein